MERGGENVISFDNTKAGLQAVDKAAVEAIIKETSQGSLFYINEQRKADLRRKKVLQLQEIRRSYELIKASDSHRLRQIHDHVHNMESALEAGRNLDRIFCHLDMDMFYAAVEQKKRPELANVPLGVGSAAMLSTTNYVARQYGVRAGMPGFIGRKLCPALVLVPTDFESYRAEARSVREIVADYDPNYHSLGLDEVTLELTDYITEHWPEARSLDERYAAADEIMQACRRRVKETTQLTASAGIAPTPNLSKIASNVQKPDGQHTLKLETREQVIAYMGTLACRQVPGIGKSQEELLAGLGLHTVKDLYDHRMALSFIFKPRTFEFLLRTAIGVGGFLTAASDKDKDPAPEEVEPTEPHRKSLGQECTFYNLKSRLEFQEVAYTNLRESLRGLKKEDLVCGRVVLKLKHKSFRVKYYSKNVQPHTADEGILRRLVDELLLPIVDGFADYRLLGVRFEKLLLTEQVRKLGATDQPTLLSFVHRKRPRGGFTPTEDSANDHIMTITDSASTIHSTNSMNIDSCSSSDSIDVDATEGVEEVIVLEE